MLNKDLFKTNIYHIKNLHNYIKAHKEDMDEETYQNLELSICYYISLFCDKNKIFSEYWRMVIGDLLLENTERILYPLSTGDFEIITLDNLYTCIKAYNEEAKYNAE